MSKNFEENIDVRVTSAQIGISKANWDFAEHNWTKNQAKDFMKKRFYDVLPIKSKDGTYDKYWTTEKNGDYDSIIEAEIKDSDKVYYLTELKDLLVKFQESDNTSYFLSNYESINGLVSNVNLNSKPVYVYFYSLISRCEIELGLWIKRLITENEIIKLISDKSKKPEDKLSQETLNRFNSDREKNEENHFVEYLYFSQFEYILRQKRLLSALGYNSNNDFSKDFKIIKKYRNWFAHPLNSPKSSMSKDFYQLHRALERLLSTLNSLSVILLKAYFDTSYETNETPKFKILIGQINEELNTYLAKENLSSWAFITAENPHSTNLPMEENEYRNSQLEKIIQKQSYMYIKGKGIPKDKNWNPENSYLVMNMSKAKAKELCTKFEQNAFIFGEIDKAPELIRIKYGR